MIEKFAPQTIFWQNFIRQAEKQPEQG